MICSISAEVNTCSGHVAFWRTQTMQTISAIFCLLFIHIDRIFRFIKSVLRTPLDHTNHSFFVNFETIQTLKKGFKISDRSPWAAPGFWAHWQCNRSPHRPATPSHPKNYFTRPNFLKKKPKRNVLFNLTEKLDIQNDLLNDTHFVSFLLLVLLFWFCSEMFDPINIFRP